MPIISRANPAIPVVLHKNTQGGREMKKTRLQYLGLAAVTALLAFVSGCSDSGTGTAVPGATVSGVAATGSPMAGDVTLKDSAGKTATAKIAQNGTYSVDLSGLKAPYLLQAAASNGKKYYSFADGAGRANINPLSSAIVANAAGVADPATAFSTADQAMLTKIKNGLPASTTNMKTRLAQLLSRYNVEGLDPIKGYYEANHQGLDGMFDDADIQISNGTIKIKNRKSNNDCFTGNLSDDKNDIYDEGKIPQPAGAPTAPTITATADVGQNSITWPAVAGAKSYNLYFSNYSGVSSATGTKISDVTSPYTHTGLTAGTPYYYVMTASNAAGTSAASTRATATPTAAPSTVTAPVAPTLTATAGTTLNTITWPAVTGATSYDLYWSPTTGVTPATGTKIANVTSPYTHTGLTAATPYYYTMTASNAAGASPAATQATATPTAAAPAPNGAALYATICQGCHGPLAASTRLGRSAAQITASKTTSPTHQTIPAFQALTPAEISAIAVALGGAP